MGVTPNSDTHKQLARYFWANIKLAWSRLRSSFDMRSSETTDCKSSSGLWYGYFDVGNPASILGTVIYHCTLNDPSFLCASLAGERCIGWWLSLSLSIKVAPFERLDTEWSSYLCLAVPMHQRFSLNAASGSKLSDVDQFTFNNQQICWQHIFSEQTVCADAQLNATVCHFCRYNKPSASA